MTPEQAEALTSALVELITAIVRDEIDSHSNSGDSFSGCAAYRHRETVVELLSGRPAR